MLFLNRFNGNSTLAQAGGTPSAPLAVFDSGDISASVTLADSDRTIVSAAANFLGARTVETFSTGKYYCECESPNITSGNFLAGIVGSTFSAASTAITSALTYYSQGPAIYKSGTLLSLTSSLPNATALGIAVDVDNTLIWFRVGAVWQNSGDPAAGTGGFDYSPYITNPIAFAGCMYTNTERQEWNFGQAAFAQTPPTGFTTHA